MSFSRLMYPVACVVLLTAPLSAQDVLQRGDQHGVRPPDWIRAALAADSTAFEFRRAWKGKLEQARAQKVAAKRRGVYTDTLSRGDAARLGAVMTGILRVPVLPFVFSDAPRPPYRREVLRRRLFGDRIGDTLTVSSYYDEVSRGMFGVRGDVAPWTAVHHASTAPTTDERTLGRILKQVLDAADKTIDFRKYDRNGDGFVDVAAFYQPAEGGECGDKTKIWSHRWTYGGLRGDQKPYRTKSGVLISDYIIEAALACGTDSPADANVFAHELGHALGLPDLYSTTDPPTNSGIGVWGLMGHGPWNKPYSPSYMEAWSRAELGWLRVETISRPQHVSLPPVNSTGVAARIDIPESPGEYFLLENRQPIGSDRHLKAPGMLVWHVDSAIIANRAPYNTVENDPDRRGLTLVEADGRWDLRDRKFLGGDADPFPGSQSITQLNAATVPSSSGYKGPTGISLHNITLANQQITFDLAFDPVVAVGSQSALTGPFAIIQFKGPVTQADTANLTQKGFRVVRVLAEANSVYVQVPANASGPLSQVSPKIDKMSTRMRPSRPPK